MAFHPLRHFITITRHRHAVLRYCFRIGLYRQGLTHDLSKYLFSEFIPGAKYYLGNRSPNELERKKKGYSAAWLHHKGRNKHHLEYWTDYSKGAYRGIDMPLNYILESVCDRIAASRTYNGKMYKEEDAYHYYMNSRKAYLISEKTDLMFKYFLAPLESGGEKACFERMRAALKSEASEGGFTLPSDFS